MAAGFHFTDYPVENGANLVGGAFGEIYHLPGRPPYPHRGVDFNVVGVPVYNRANRRQRAVSVYNPDGSYGVAVALHDQEDDYFHLYAHLAERYYGPGDWVEPGAVIGRSGATGYVYGAHLHWQMDREGVWSTVLADNLDPILFINPPEEAMGMTPDERAELDTLKLELRHTRDELAITDKLLAGYGIRVQVTDWEATELGKRGFVREPTPPDADDDLIGAEAKALLDIRNASLFGGLLGLNEAVLDMKEAIIDGAAIFDANSPYGHELAPVLARVLRPTISG